MLYFFYKFAIRVIFRSPAMWPSDLTSTSLLYGANFDPAALERKVGPSKNSLTIRFLLCSWKRCPVLSTFAYTSSRGWPLTAFVGTADDQFRIVNSCFSATRGKSSGRAKIERFEESAFRRNAAHERTTGAWDSREAWRTPQAAGLL